MSAEVDAFLAALPDDARTTLEILRRTIRAVAPNATETITYGVPAFKLSKTLVSYGAGKSHCALYVMSPAVMERHADELRSYDTSKGTIRFPTNKPLPAELVRTLVEARIAEVEGQA